jgi:hypothetical protein
MSAIRKSYILKEIVKKKTKNMEDFKCDLFLRNLTLTYVLTNFVPGKKLLCSTPLMSANLSNPPSNFTIW